MIRNIFNIIRGLGRSGAGDDLARFGSTYADDIARIAGGPAVDASQVVRQQPGVLGRLGSRGMQFWNKLGTPAKVVVGAGVPLIGGIQAVRGIQDYLTNEPYTPASTESTLTRGGMTPTQSALAGASEADAIRNLLSGPEFKSAYTSPGYAAATQQLNERQARSLENYLNQAMGSAQQGARGMAAGYGQYAKGLGNLAQQTQVSGQRLAADIDRLYQDLGLAQADIAAASQVPTGAVDTSGLTGVSGEMATAPDETTAYGGSLADYLGQEANLDAQALEMAARSQAAYGGAAGSDLVNAINQAAAQQRFAAEQRAADRFFQAQQMEAQDRRAFDEANRQRQQELAFRLFEAEQNAKAKRAQIGSAVDAARAQVAASFATANDAQKKTWARTAGITWRGRQDDGALRSAMNAIVAEDPFNASIRFGLYGSTGA
jgi:hypothetical protein